MRMGAPMGRLAPMGRGVPNESSGSNVSDLQS